MQWEIKKKNKIKKAGVHKFSKNLEATPIFQVPEKLHKASSILGTTNIWCHYTTFNHLGNSAPAKRHQQVRRKVVTSPCLINSSQQVFV